MGNHCTTQHFINHDSRNTANSGIISEHPSAPSLSVFVVLLMSQANWLKKFNLLISAQSTVQQSQLNEELIIPHDEFMVTGLKKLVRTAKMRYGKVRVIALTLQWWGSNYIEGWVSLNFQCLLFLSFTWWKTNVNFDLFLAHGFQNSSERPLTLFVWKETDITFPK